MTKDELFKKFTDELAKWRPERRDELMEWCKGDLVMHILEIESQQKAVNELARLANEMLKER